MEIIIGPLIRAPDGERSLDFLFLWSIIPLMKSTTIVTIQGVNYSVSSDKIPQLLTFLAHNGAIKVTENAQHSQFKGQQLIKG